MTNPTIGFIGLGLMGGNMAECLQSNGYDLVVMGRNKEAIAKTVARGAVEVTTPESASRGERYCHALRHHV